MTKVLFTLPSENNIGSGECILLGDFNDWKPTQEFYLQKQADGSLQLDVELEAGKEYQYRYFFSNGVWVNDNAEKVLAEVSGHVVENCIVRVSAPELMVKKVLTKNKPSKVKAAVKPKPVVVKDNLTKIEGIGKKIESLLYKNQIYSYKHLSKSTIKKLKEILTAAGNNFNTHNPGSWPKQAKLAAENKWEELENLQKKLIGGK